MSIDAARTPSEIDRIAEDWVDTVSQFSPLTASYIGRTEHDGRLDDFSPEGIQHERAESARVLARLATAAPRDAIDEVTRMDLAASLELRIETIDAQLPLRDLNVIASPAQSIREAFDLMPTEGEQAWSNIAERLTAVPSAVQGYIDTLRAGMGADVTPARRQVAEVVAQVRRISAADGFFPSFVSGAATQSLPATLQARLTTAAAGAAEAYAGLATMLESELAPAATTEDAIGRDLYALSSRAFLGTTIDLEESYAWGIEELARMVAEQESIAREIVPGGGVAEAVAFLDTDPSRKLHGTAALQAWMQETSDAAVEALGKTHFDIPERVRALECMIAPTEEGGIYYTGPSDDFSRPGRMWWSVPQGVTEFDTWRELTTVYHEGVPGHHLQIAQAVHNSASLNTWRRQLAGTSGQAEGWALYAERLMEELGYLDDPADRFGMLDGQRMRAARVVLDIGMHLGLERPDGAGRWTAEFAHEFFAANVNMNESFVRFEVNRYLGWPGQAPSYKIGQRIWEELRDEARERAGADFQIKEFHRRALDLGVVGLDTLRFALSRQ